MRRPGLRRIARDAARYRGQPCPAVPQLVRRVTFLCHCPRKNPHPLPGFLAGQHATAQMITTAAGMRRRRDSGDGHLSARVTIWRGPTRLRRHAGVDIHRVSGTRLDRHHPRAAGKLLGVACWAKLLRMPGLKVWWSPPRPVLHLPGLAAAALQKDSVVFAPIYQAHRLRRLQAESLTARLAGWFFGGWMTARRHHRPG